MPPLPFAEWAPDQPDLGTAAREASGVIPEAQGYRPFKALATTSSALTARAQGAAWFRASDGTTKNFAGDATKLYLLSSSTWTDVSRVSGGAYATDASGNWRFAQFADVAYATNGVDALQSFTLASSSNFAAATGSPPIGTYIGVVRNFLVLAKISSFPQRVQWSGDNNSTTWTTSATTGADNQDLPDGGEITGFAGGEVGVVLQESAIRRMSFEGSPTWFRFDKISNEVGCTIPNSVAVFDKLVFFSHRSGFYMLRGGQELVAIGQDKVNRWFWGLLDQTNMHRCSAAIDPLNSLYVISFPTGSSGTASMALIYNWKADRWSYAYVTAEYIYASATQQTWTLEDLDAFTTLEAVPYSLDSSYWTGSRQLLLAGFYTDHKSGTFSGDNLAAVIDTGEFQPVPGVRSRIRGARPLVDGGTPSLAVGVRKSQQSVVAWTAARTINNDGFVPLNTQSRYARFRLTMPAASTYNWALGIDDADMRGAGFR
jgi:hypothetical protein